MKYECGNSVVNRRNMGMIPSELRAETCTHTNTHKPKGHVVVFRLCDAQWSINRRKSASSWEILRLWQILINILFARRFHCLRSVAAFERSKVYTHRMYGDMSSRFSCFCCCFILIMLDYPIPTMSCVAQLRIHLFIVCALRISRVCATALQRVKCIRTILN